MVPPRAVLVLAYAFHEFAYAVGEQRVQVANLSSPWVGASPPAVLRSHIHLEGFQIDGKAKPDLPLNGTT